MGAGCLEEGPHGVRQGAVARGVTIEVVQQRGVRKAEFAAEMEALARTYLRFLRERWPRLGR